LIAYYQHYGAWPAKTYKDPVTGSALGAFLDKAISRQIHLTDDQKAMLSAVDPNVFGAKREAVVKPMPSVTVVEELAALAAPTLVTPKPSVMVQRLATPAAPKVLTKDEMISLLVAYHQSNGKWPVPAYKDPETGAALGFFLDKAITRQIHLNDDQKAKISAVDANVFGKGKREAAVKPQPSVLQQPQQPAFPMTVAKRTTLSKNDQINLLIAYHKANGHWPSVDYKDTETNAALGAFLDKIITRQISLTNAQKNQLLAVDANVLGVKRVPRAAASLSFSTPAAIKAPNRIGSHSSPSTTSAPPIKAKARATLTKDDKVALLVAYHQKHGSWPSKSYRDPETSAALGSFLDKAISRQLHLSKAQRAKLLDVDANVFGKVKKREAAPIVATASMSEIPAPPNPNSIPREISSSKDDQIALLLAYHAKNGKWPPVAYKDPVTALPLGSFLDHAISRQVSLTEAQRAKLVAMDPSLFQGKNERSRRKRAAAKMGKIAGGAVAAVVSAIKPKRAPPKDEQINLLVDYHQKHGEWPAKTYKDSETGAALGTFFERAISRQISLTETQRAKLSAVDANIFGVKQSATAKTTAPIEQQSPVIVQASFTSPPAAPSKPTRATSSIPKSMTKNEQVALLVAYHAEHQLWPSSDYQDPATGAAVGAFLQRAIAGQISLSEIQRGKLLAVDPDVFASPAAEISTPTSKEPLPTVEEKPARQAVAHSEPSGEKPSQIALYELEAGVTMPFEEIFDPLNLSAYNSE